MHDSTGSTHRPTLSGTERSRKQIRIPSSMTPSPMKIPRGGSGFPGSPAKVSNEVTKALQDSIASLLGKRQPSVDDEIVARTGKRARPHRPKVINFHIFHLQSAYCSPAQISTRFTCSGFRTFGRANIGIRRFSRSI
jgi:hypothetical protein